MGPRARRRLSRPLRALRGSACRPSRVRRSGRCDRVRDKPAGTAVGFRSSLWPLASFEALPALLVALIRVASDTSTYSVAVTVVQQCAQALCRNTHRYTRLAGKEGFQLTTGKQAPDGALADLQTLGNLGHREGAKFRKGRSRRHDGTPDLLVVPHGR